MLLLQIRKINVLQLATIRLACGRYPAFVFSSKDQVNHIQSYKRTRAIGCADADATITSPRALPDGIQPPDCYKHGALLPRW